MPSGDGLAFGPFRLDVRTKRLLRDGAALDVSPREFDALLALVTRAPDLVTKDALIKAAWHDVAVGDSSLVKVIRQLRDCLDPDDEERYIQTVVRRGYRFVAPVTRERAIATDADLDALMEPHRAFIDGRAALLSLGRERFAHAIALFRDLVARDPHRAICHVGLANAAVLIYESTRAEAAPETAMLHLAERHAREALRLDPELGEAWITLGFVLERTGDRRTSTSALRKGVELDPFCLRHHLRHALGTWGEDRIAASMAAVRLWPRLPVAHLLSATVFVARDNGPEAERHLDRGIDALSDPAQAEVPVVGLYWLKSLLVHARGTDDDALAWIERELALEDCGHMYARECCASAWYAKGAIAWRRGDASGARAAYHEALARVPRHAMALAGIAILEGGGRAAADFERPHAGGGDAMGVDEAMARAAVLVHAGRTDEAADLCRRALAAAPPGNAGWLLPVDPLIGVRGDRAAWASTIDLLGRRAGNWLG